MVTLDLGQLLLDAFCGNLRMEELLARHADRIALTFSGHTHRANTGNLGSLRGINVGSDYPFELLPYLDWPACTVEEVQFDP